MIFESRLALVGPLSITEAMDVTHIRQFGDEWDKLLAMDQSYKHTFTQERIP